MASGKLTARKVETAKPGSHGDGDGLWLVVSPSGARKWVFRFAWRGKPANMGLGAAGAVSLAEARRSRDEARWTLASGRNPREARDEAKTAEAGKPTFGEMADALIEAKASEWRNTKHRAQWAMTLTRYAARLRSKPVDKIDTAAVLEVLSPLWTARPETASPSRAYRGGAGRRESAGVAFRREPGVMARSSFPFVAEAWEADTRPSCGDGV